MARRKTGPGRLSRILTAHQKNHIPLKMGIKDALELIPEYSSKSLTEFVYFSEGCLEALDLLGLEHEKSLLKFIKLKLKGMAYSQYALIVTKFDNLPGFLHYVQMRDFGELNDKRTWEEEMKKVRQEIDESVRTYGARMETTLQCALTALKLRNANNESYQAIELLANECFEKNMDSNVGKLYSNSVLDKGKHIVNKVLWMEQRLQGHMNSTKCKICCSIHHTDGECKADEKETPSNGLQVNEENVKEVKDKSVISLEKSLEQHKKFTETVVPLQSSLTVVSEKEKNYTHLVQSDSQLEDLLQRLEESIQIYSQMENILSIAHNLEQELKEQLNYPQYKLKWTQTEANKVASLKEQLSNLQSENNKTDLLKSLRSQVDSLTSQVNDQHGTAHGNQSNSDSCENQIELQKKCIKAREKSMDSYLDVDEQKRLEMKHREEKDELFRKFVLRMEELEMINREEKDSEESKILGDLRTAKAEMMEKQNSEMLKLVYSARENCGKNESLHQDGSSEPPNSYPVTAPPPEPPALLKTDLYTDPSELADVDKIASDVAKEEQDSFTDLVRRLMKHCDSDYEKARAIYRWISMKDLNVKQLKPDIKDGTPMGIKLYSETYEVLFQRLCSYAGLHCKIIEGYYKGYSEFDAL